jgi:ABC-type antimicrobial peptide transport system permease subunit
MLALVLGESLFLCTIAGALGIAIINIAFPFFQHAIADFSLIPLLLPPSAAVTGFGYILLVAFLSAFFPALRVKRLNVVDALTGRRKG